MVGRRPTATRISSADELPTVVEVGDDGPAGLSRRTAVIFAPVITVMPSCLERSPQLLTGERLLVGDETLEGLDDA